MTTRLRIYTINLMKLIKNEKKYAKEIGVEVRLKEQVKTEGKPVEIKN